MVPSPGNVHATQILQFTWFSPASIYDIYVDSGVGNGDPQRKDYVTAQYHSIDSVTAFFMIRQGNLKLITFGDNLCLLRGMHMSSKHPSIYPCF